MSYVIKNNSTVSKALAMALKEELIIEGNFSREVAEIVVNHYDLENRGLGIIVADIIRIANEVSGN